LIGKALEAFTTKYPRTAYMTFAQGNPKLEMPEFKPMIDKYQDPTQADNIAKIQKELDETKVILHNTVESVLARGEKLDDLVAKSEGLSMQSKMFYTQVNALGTDHLAMSLILLIGEKTKLLLHCHVKAHQPQLFIPRRLFSD
jgi:hypothetical protein